MGREGTPGASEGRAAARHPRRVVVVGAASRDVVASDPRGWRLGGGVTYGALTLARLGLRVRALVGVDSEAGSAIELDQLSEAGVEVVRLLLPRGPVFENVETAAGRRQRCLVPSSVLPDSTTGLRDAEAVLLAPVAAELSETWATAIEPQAVVGLGLQGLLRRLRPGAPVERRSPWPSALLARANLVGLSLDDLPTARDLAAVLALAAPGATVLVTDAARGGSACVVPDHDARVSGAGASGAPAVQRYRAVQPDTIVDPTGAGDVFLAAVLATRLAPELLVTEPGTAGARTRLALRFAAAAASLVVEGPGLAGVPDLGAVRRRLERARRRARRCTTASCKRGSGRPSHA